MKKPCQIRGKLLLIVAALFLSLIVIHRQAISSGTYIPPPPPKAMPKLDPKLFALGQSIFERGVFFSGNLKIYHHLGPKKCLACHAKNSGFKAKKLAKNFNRIDLAFRNCVASRSGGNPKFLDAKTRQALKTYLFFSYKLQRYRLSY